ncbi:hypothetical protein [Mycobacterium malmoense]|uniref:hypothetical protein n=1 Tax=Mycobacterium malmoense TaxID=1780 RepID=UPI00159EE83C|nr:hypothetical protein [Mycobacterium malmoense]
MERNPLEEAFYRAAEYGGGQPMTFDVDLDHATVVPGSPGLYNGLAIAQWKR